MAEIVYDDSCLRVEEQMRELSLDHRPTLICGLYAPAVGEVALVRSSKADEAIELSLKHVQGGLKEGLSVPGTFEAELVEEIGMDLDAITAVYGLATVPPILGGRPRSGKASKAFGVVCGIVDGVPPAIAPGNPAEIDRAGWFSLEAAERMFMTQVGYPKTAGRGERSLLVLSLIAAALPDSVRRPY